jgi:hypothetical protein
MRSAYDFSTAETGEGIKENEGCESFAAKVIKKSYELMGINFFVDSSFFQS